MENKCPEEVRELVPENSTLRDKLSTMPDHLKSLNVGVENGHFTTRLEDSSYNSQPLHLHGQPGRNSEPSGQPGRDSKPNKHKTFKTEIANASTQDVLPLAQKHNEMSKTYHKLKQLRTEVEQIVNRNMRVTEITEHVKTYQYSAKDINTLLIQSKGQHSYKIIDAIDLTDTKHMQRIQEVVDILKEKNYSAVAVIPINLGSVINDQGSNWASLVIKIVNSNELQILHQDYFNEAMKTSLKDLSLMEITSYKHFKTQQRKNNYDSGPLAVFNLHSLAKKDELSDVTDTMIENQRKMLALQQLENTQYKPLIHELAHAENQEDLEDLIKLLEDLSYLNTQLGELSGELKYYNDAALFHQFVIAIMKNKGFDEELELQYKALDGIRFTILKTIKGSEQGVARVDTESEAHRYKAILVQLRKNTKDRFERILTDYKEEYEKELAKDISDTDSDEDNPMYTDWTEKIRDEYFSIKITSLFANIAASMRQFLGKLYEDSEREISKPPCGYTVMGLGSMALNQMTPYSDLEFAILTENEKYKTSDDVKIKDFFKNLSHLVNFKVINLGESVIPTSKYGIDMSHLVKVGVNFDLGGKTPLGRIDGDKPYELIKTVEWMMHYVRNENDGASNIDKNLPYILENVCEVYKNGGQGSKQLLVEYQHEVETFLIKPTTKVTQNQLNCEIRAIQILEKGAVEINYSQGPNKPYLIKGEGDIHRLRPFAGLESKLFNVKQDLYRLPDRLLYNLGLFYGIRKNSAWDTLDELGARDIINPKAIVKLKYAMSYAAALRLKTYHYYDRQSEHLTAFNVEQNLKIVQAQKSFPKLFSLDENFAPNVFPISEEENSWLFEYFYTALPLHKCVEKFCQNVDSLSYEQRRAFFKNFEFYDASNLATGRIHFRLANYEIAKEHFELELKRLRADSRYLQDINFKMIIMTLCDIYGILYENATHNQYTSHQPAELFYIMKAQDHQHVLSKVFLEATQDSKDIDICTRYANFLIKQNNHTKALRYLKFVLSVENLSNLTNTIKFGPKNYLSLHRSLQDMVMKEGKNIGVITTHYACYLLIMDYKYFDLKHLEGKDEYVRIFRELVKDNSSSVSEYMLSEVKQDFFGQQLEEAFKSHSREVFDYALTQIEDLNFQYQGKTILMHAIHNNFEHGVATLLHKGARIDLTDRQGYTAWSRALSSSETSQSIIELFIKRKVENHEERNKLENSVKLWFAVKRGDLDVVEQQINKKIDLDTSIGSFRNITPLINAIKIGNLSIVSSLVEHGANVNLADENEVSPLYYSLGYAKQAMSANIVEFLVSKGANVNQSMYDGDTPLHMASYKANIGAMKLLLDHGAIVNAVNKRGDTSLHVLIKQKNLKVEQKLSATKYLLMRSASVTMKNNYSKRAIDLAKYNFSEAIEYLENLETLPSLNDFEAVFVDSINNFSF